MSDDINRSKMLNIGIWIAGLATALAMVADVAVRPTQVWLSLMPAYCLAAFALLHSLRHLGTRKGLWFLALGLVLPFIAEYLGTNFGAIFGSHWFSRARDLSVEVGVTLPGNVPLASVLTWYGMLYIAFLTSTYILNSKPRESSSFAAVPLTAGLLLALWQLAAGPVASARHLVGFGQNGFYHGIPLSSFVGWFSTGMFITLFIQAVEPETASVERFAAAGQTSLAALGMFGLAVLYSASMCFRFKMFGAGWLGVVVILMLLLAVSIRSRTPVRAAELHKAASPV